MARFLPTRETPNLKNLAYEARATFGTGECRIEKSKRTLVVEFPVGAIVKKGPAFNSNEALPLRENLELFIGVRASDDSILSRQAINFDIEADRREEAEAEGTPLLEAFVRGKGSFDAEALANKSLIYLRDLVQLTILTEDSSVDTGRNYRIYIGFIITESELEYNQAGYLPLF